MNIELTGVASSVADRAARHAALADPARVQIVDRLALGDVSPSDLQDQLGMSSSLLAHHLNALHRVGMLTRSRSEADRRRSYLRLRPDALDGLGATPVRSARRIVFVCTANSARSQTAATLWGYASPIPAVSAGTHPAAEVDPRAVRSAERHGVRIPLRKPRALDGVAVDDDLLITVCDRANEELEPHAGLHWSVPDPARDGSDRAFDEAFETISRRIGEWAPRLTAA
ncbi:MAG: helix-turn-helix domain-containing protein [Micrococcales bacterium]|nr:helix-turn-helix domain-containing protein [Micrococcales bacterium]